MGFVWKTEKSKSNRATCKGCKEKIDKDVVRVGKENVVAEGSEGFSSTQWYHCHCVTARKMPSLSDFEGNGLEGLDDTQRLILSEGLETKPKRKSSGGAEGTPKKAKTDGAAGGGGAASPGADAGPPDWLDNTPEMTSAHETYSKMGVSELKDYLRTNKQLLGGTKPELVKRCCDGQVFGSLPKCPECKKARVRVVYAAPQGHFGQGDFSCPGHYDADAGGRTSCAFTSKKLARPAWRSPSDPEPDEGAEEVAAAGGEWCAEFAGFAPDDKKSVASALLAQARVVKLGLPKDDLQAKMACYQRLVATRESETAPWRPAEALVALEKEFPKVVDIKFDAPQDGEMVGENEDIAKQFLALAHWVGVQKKENFGFKVNAYKKVAAALRDTYASKRLTAGKAIKDVVKTGGNGIGKASGEKIEEFLATGVIQSLVDLKAELGAPADE